MQLKGPLGLWKFPILNMLRRKKIVKKYSIIDHKVIIGAPNYISAYEIKEDEYSTPWEIELVYDADIARAFYDKYDTLTDRVVTKYSKGQILELPQDTIDYVKANELYVIYEQISPI